MKTPWLAVVIGCVGGLIAANSAKAGVTIDNFHNFQANALYASWSTPAATITSNATTWAVSSIGYGSLWKYEGDINGSGYGKVQLTLDISGDPGFVAGPIVDLVDNNGVWATYAWYGQTVAGSHTLVADLGSSPAAATFNWADIQHIHLECDPGSAPTLTYSLTFRDLSLVPEPTSLALLALGAAGWLIARRRN